MTAHASEQATSHSVQMGNKQSQEGSRREAYSSTSSRGNGKSKGGAPPPRSPSSNAAPPPSPSRPAQRVDPPASPARSQSQPSPAPSPSASPSSSPAPSPSKQAPSPSKPATQQPVRSPVAAEDQISNWKLFNDLENREEADVLELSVFLDALTRYMPGVKGSDSSPPPSENVALSKTVSEQVVGQIDIANMYLQSSELGEVITLEAVKELIESCKNGLKIPRQEIIRVVNQAMRIFKQESTLVNVTIAPANHITVIGDLHGQLDDLLIIFRENGFPSEKNPYVFNGDFVDRGDRGVEIAVIIYLFKILYPKHVFVNRGNHEESSITQVFGFMKEVETKYDTFIYDLFCESFKWLPMATLLDQRVLVLHGGVPRENVLLREFALLDRSEYDLTRWRDRPRHKEQKEPHRLMQMMRDLLWSDPKSAKGWEENKRGAGILYGPDVVQKFMSKNRLALIVRSHECVPRGFDWPYPEKGMLVTLFSASNYCGKANNLGCFMRIPADKNAKPAFFQYMASAESRDMAVSNLDGLFSLIIEHNEELLEEFEKEDKAKTGKLTVAAWGKVMEEVLDLSLDWNALQPLLTSLDEGVVPYKGFLARYNAAGGVGGAAKEGEDTADPERLKRRQAFNTLYRHRARLEALFRVLDRDGNGTITLDELENGIKLLNEHLPEGMKAFSTNAMDFMSMLDFSHDNELNINEFMEGFRINAKMTVQAKWKRAKKKIKALSALGVLKSLNSQDHDFEPPAEQNENEKKLARVANGGAEPVLTRHGSIQRIGLAAEEEVEVDDVAADKIVEEEEDDHEVPPAVATTTS
ncbi:hypothetical protein Poli38472_010070 [Pythium oligandrum]|uniref:Serine/threonine-protein phosphatase n=1 Tax=Pythium oligandrum TaxID=41045 RepID=A0A8K1C8T1_PYTOL|nr:hypothetical protein Poli38472_010070 [Pythium oligandrum]|eukprot:TMW58511.1 hypothetical protein Poli38472_010070 [Pythium oligandrum]